MEVLSAPDDEFQHDSVEKPSSELSVDTTPEADRGDSRMQRVYQVLQNTLERYKLVADKPKAQSEESDSSAESLTGTNRGALEVLKKVQAAAEHNEPIERSYERRAEVKDEPGYRTAADSVNLGANGHSVSDEAKIPPSNPLGRNLTDDNPKKYENRFGGFKFKSFGITFLYRTAVLWGVVWGLSVVVFILIFALTA